MRLGGWTRLSILLSSVWVVTIALVVGNDVRQINEFDRRSSIFLTDVQLSEAEAEKVLASEKSRPDHQETVGLTEVSKLSDEELKRLFNEQASVQVARQALGPVDGNRKSPKFNLWQQEPNVGVICLIALGPPLALWLLGAAIGWVYRGFRQTGGN